MQRPRRRLAPVVAVVSLVALLVALGTSAAAGADSIASKRAQAAAAEGQLNALYAQEDAAVNAYDRAQSKLSGVKHRIAANRIMLKVARANLRAARAQLAEIVVADYKGDDPNAAMYVLGAQSFSDLVNRIDVMNRSSRSQASVLRSVTSAERQVKRRQAILRVEALRARKLVGRTQAAKARVQGLISSQQSLIAGLNAQIRNLVQQRKARLAREARAPRRRRSGRRGGLGAADAGHLDGPGSHPPADRPGPARQLGRRAGRADRDGRARRPVRVGRREPGRL